MAAQDASSSHGGSKSGLAMFTHRMKESLGLAEKTTSNEQVRDLSKRLDMLAEHLKMIIKGMQKTTAGLRDIAEVGVELSNQLTDCSVLFAEDQERIFLSGSSSRTAEFERVIEDMRIKLATAVDVDIIAGLRSILETEIKDCKQQKAAYESSRVDLSNAQTKLATAQKGKQQPKIDTAQADLETMKKKFEQCERETLVRLRDGLTVSEYKMLDTLIRYVDTQKAFYNRGFQMLNASMVDVAEYRRQAEDNKRKLAARPQNPKRLTVRMSIAPKSGKKKFFGSSLQDLEAEGRCLDGVPIFLLNVIVYIEQWGLEEEGIFRVAGTNTQTDIVRVQVEANGGDYDWGVTGEKIYSATDLMKQFLRELPQSLLPQEFTSAAFALPPAAEPTDNVAAIITLIQRLPIGVQRILKLLFMMLFKISKVKANRMSPVALATCLGPNLCNVNFGPDVDPFELTAQMNGLVAFIIQHAEALFQHVNMDNAPGSSSPRGLTAAAPSAPARTTSNSRLSMNPPSDPAPAPGPSSPRSNPVYGGVAMPSLATSSGSPPSSSNPLSNSGSSSTPTSARAAPPLPNTPASAVSTRSNGTNNGSDALSPRKVPPPVSPRPPTASANPGLTTSTSSRTLPVISPNMVNPALQPLPSATAEVAHAEAPHSQQ